MYSLSLFENLQYAYMLQFTYLYLQIYTSINYVMKLLEMYILDRTLVPAVLKTAWLFLLCGSFLFLKWHLIDWLKFLALALYPWQQLSGVSAVTGTDCRPLRPSAHTWLLTRSICLRRSSDADLHFFTKHQGGTDDLHRLLQTCGSITRLSCRIF